MRRVLLLCSVGIPLLLSTLPGAADVRLPAVLGDNMVLQRDLPICLWGWADPGEVISVSLNGCAAQVTTAADGTWKTSLAAMKAGGPFTLTLTGKNAIELKNIMIGEVWVCSGQSNMQMSVRSSYNNVAEELEADYPNIRLFTVSRVTSDKPLDDVKGRWDVCTPETVPGFSAVAYFFGRDLHKALGVPVGLINTSWGGTPAEAWTSLPALKAVPELKPILDRWDAMLANYPAAMEKYNKETVPAWEKAVADAKAQGKPVPRKPSAPMGADSPHRPANLYNAMIAPLLNYGIRGAIWYQGESNAGRAYQYRTLFAEMIKNWRADWGIGDFPFGFVQLANYMAVEPQPANSAWAELREAQTMALSLPNTGMAVIIDIGEANDIHPKNKQDVGKRLSMWALGSIYGKDVAFSSPLYDSMTVEGDRIRVRFKHAFGGLMTPACAPVNGFAIAGDDQKFYWADAVIQGDSVVVSSKTVAKPVAVRYGWGNNPVCNLYSGAGLPASPFRTDDWPGVTINNK